MSSEVYELMKRSDEGAVVEKAHRRARFVEDCVRVAIRGAVERFDRLRDDAFVSSRQENLETIHLHSVVAERFGLLGELRRELDSRHGTSRITRRCANGSTPPPDQRSRIRSAPCTLRWSSAEPLASATPRRSTSAA